MYNFSCLVDAVLGNISIINFIFIHILVLINKKRSAEVFGEEIKEKALT